MRSTPDTFLLDIVLTPTGEGTYQAEGRDTGGAVVARHTFRHRPDLLATHQQLCALEQRAMLSGDDEAEVKDQALAGALLAEAEAFGPDLHERLFGGELGAHWESLRAEAQAAGQSARLRLRIAEDVPELDTLPCEFLHDGQAFLSPDRRVLLARGVASLPDFPVPATESGPLAVLVIVSNPLDLPDHQAFEPGTALHLFPILSHLDVGLERSFELEGALHDLAHQRGNGLHLLVRGLDD